MSCSSCLQGHLHDGIPTGIVTKVHGRSTYVATPPGGVQASAIVVIVPDAFGWEFVNNRLLADQYARRGNFLVYLPDFMDGRSAPLWTLNSLTRITNNDSFSDWIWKPFYVLQFAYGVLPFFLYNRFALAWPRIHTFFENVRLDEGLILPVGAAGFCWGGKPVLTLTHPHVVTTDGQALVEAVFTGHPSALSLPSDVAAITKPSSIAIGDKDVVMPLSHTTLVQEAWSTLGEDMATEVVIYPGAGHGFCVRVDPKNANEFAQSKEAEEQAVRWFTKHLK